MPAFSKLNLLKNKRKNKRPVLVLIGLERWGPAWGQGSGRGSGSVRAPQGRVNVQKGAGTLVLRPEDLIYSHHRGICVLFK